MRLGLGEIVIIVAIILLLFGPSRLPQLADSLGKGIRSFRHAVEGSDADSARESRAGESDASSAAGSRNASTSEKAGKPNKPDSRQP